MYHVYAGAGILDVIAVTLDGESGHFPKSSHKRCYRQKLDRPGQGGGGCEISRKCGGSRRRRPFPNSGPSFGSAFGAEGSLPMLHKMIPILPLERIDYGDGSRFGWAHYPKGRCSVPPSNRNIALIYSGRLELPRSPMQGRQSEFENKKEKKMCFQDRATRFSRNRFSSARSRMSAIFAERVVFMSKRSWTEIPASRSQKSIPREIATNAVNILASCVIPFFDRQGAAIKEIHTRTTSRILRFGADASI